MKEIRDGQDAQIEREEKALKESGME